MPRHAQHQPTNLLEAATRADIAHHIIAGFSTAFPTLADLWRQIDAALADVAALAAEVTRLAPSWPPSGSTAPTSPQPAGPPSPPISTGNPTRSSYLRDELHAQGFSVPAGGRSDQSPPDAPPRPPDAPLRPAAHGRHQLR